MIKGVQNKGIDRVPNLVSQAINDEFLLSALDPKWTVITNTDSTQHFNTIIPGGLLVKFSSTSGQYIIEQAFAPGASTALSIAFCLIGDPVVNFHTSRLECRNTSNTDAVSILHQFATGQKVQHTTRTGSTDTNNVQPATLSPATGKLYLRLERNASNAWSSYYSYDGHRWVATNLNYSNSFTVQALRLIFDAGTGTAALFRPGILWLRHDYSLVT